MPRLDITVVVNRIALEVIAEIVDQIAFFVRAEIAGAGVAQRTVVADLKKAIAVDGEVQRVLGVVDVALVELLRHVRKKHPTALRVFASTKDRRCVDVRKLCTRLFEARSPSVGDVVTRDIEVFAGGTHAAEADIERHELLLLPDAPAVTDR